MTKLDYDNSNMKIEFSKTNNLFILLNMLLFENTYNTLDAETFYIRISTKLSKYPYRGKFKVITKLKPIVI